MDTLAGKLKKRSGWLFIDNCDVYDYAHKKDIFDGLTVILKKIRAMGKPVVVNGGDIYVTAYQSRYGSAADIMTGVNQESVWSRIDFTTKTFHTQKNGAGVFLPVSAGMQSGWNGCLSAGIHDRP